MSIMWKDKINSCSCGNSRVQLLVLVTITQVEKCLYMSGLDVQEILSWMTPLLWMWTETSSSWGMYAKCHLHNSWSLKAGYLNWVLQRWTRKVLLWWFSMQGELLVGVGSCDVHNHCLNIKRKTDDVMYTSVGYLIFVFQMDNNSKEINKLHHKPYIFQK